MNEPVSCLRPMIVARNGPEQQEPYFSEVAKASGTTNGTSSHI